jgi:hypothetical protein
MSNNCWIPACVLVVVGIVLAMADVSLSAASNNASFVVNDGCVRYLCLKNTVLQTLVPLVAVMYTLWHW